VKADVYDNLCDSAAAWRISASLVGIAVTTFGLACVSYGLQVTHRPASRAHTHSVSHDTFALISGRCAVSEPGWFTPGFRLRRAR
jgi:hypothetical protein